MKLYEVNFESIRLDTSVGEVVVLRSEIADFVKSQEDVPLPLSYMRRVNKLRETGQLELFLGAGDHQLSDFDVMLQVPRSSLRRFREELKAYIKPSPKTDRVIAEIVGEDQILFLPTYRRIEKDLRTIIPELDDYLRRFKASDDSDKKSLPMGRRTDHYVELVEFGMEDVATTFKSTLEALKESARREFNSLAGSYLRDVIRGEGHTYNRTEIERLDDNEITSILNRVEENTLGEDDKSLLRNRISELANEPNRRSGKRTRNDNAYAAHFFSKLVQAVHALKQREQSIAQFVAVCNKYLTNKSIVYNERRFDLSIAEASGRELALSLLSSGEKQIVSLFCHLYLSTPKKCLVIIDEPELSLSVPWQITLLPDVIASGRCSFLAAVTHSPFIFENELDGYTRDMQECINTP